MNINFIIFYVLTFLTNYNLSENIENEQKAKKFNEVLKEYHFQHSSEINPAIINENYKNWINDFNLIIDKRNAEELSEEERMNIVRKLKGHFNKIDSLIGNPGTGKTVSFFELIYQANSVLNDYGFAPYLAVRVFDPSRFRSSYVNGDLINLAKATTELNNLKESTNKQNQEMKILFFLRNRLCYFLKIMNLNHHLESY